MNSRAVQTKSRREELINCAYDAIRMNGPGVSMDDIAQVAGVTRVILYRYFEDRQGLKQAIIDRYQSEMVEFLNDQFADMGNILMTSVKIDVETLHGVVKQTVSRVFEFIQNDPEIYAFVTSFYTGQNDSKSLTEFAETMSRLLAKYLGDFLAHNKKDTGVAEAWAYAIVGIVHFSSIWWLNRQSVSQSRIVQYVADLIVNGIAG
jgi:AcrR family transcriptional regulator